MIEFLPSRAVLIDVFGFAVHWYAVMYLVAFGAGWWLLPHFLRLSGVTLSREERFTLLVWVMAGVLVGGRLGYVFLYEPRFFLMQPVKILALGEGGMSSHGGFIGVGVALYWLARQLKVYFWALTDAVVVPAALGLALGRVGNYINQELYVTPAAISLAVGTNLAIAAVSYWQLKKTQSLKIKNKPDRSSILAASSEVFASGTRAGLLREEAASAASSRTPPMPRSKLRGMAASSKNYGSLFGASGSVAALFLMLYSIGRFVTEYVREPEWPLIMIGSLAVTRGQLYTVFVGIVGLWVLYSVAGRRPLLPSARRKTSRYSRCW